MYSNPSNRALLEEPIAGHQTNFFMSPCITSTQDEPVATSITLPSGGCPIYRSEDEPVAGAPTTPAFGCRYVSQTDRDEPVAARPTTPSYGCGFGQSEEEPIAGNPTSVKGYGWGCHSAQTQLDEPVASGVTLTNFCHVRAQAVSDEPIANRPSVGISLCFLSSTMDEPMALHTTGLSGKGCYAA